MRLLALHVTQQLFDRIRVGHERGLTHDGRDRALSAGALRTPHIAGEQHADDPVQRIVLEYRIARVALVQDEHGCGLERHRRGNGDHVGARRHHLPRVLLRELEDALDQRRVRLLDHPALLALLHQDAQLVGGVERLFDLHGPLPEHAQDDLRRPVEQRRERPHHPFEHEQQRREHAGHLLGMRERHAAGRELAKDDVEVRDEHDGEHGRRRDAQSDFERDGQRREHACEQPGEVSALGAYEREDEPGVARKHHRVERARHRVQLV